MNTIWKSSSSFLLAWLTSALAAAITYVVGASGISGPFEIMIAIAVEAALSGVVLFVVALPLVILFKKYPIAIHWIMLVFLLVGTITGAFVYDYLAGGALKWLIVGGSIPGFVSGLAFFMVMRLTKQFQTQ